MTPVLLELGQQRLGKFLFDFEATKKTERRTGSPQLRLISTRARGSIKLRGCLAKNNGGVWLVPQKDLVALPDGQSSQDQIKNKPLFALFLCDDAQKPRI
jgi:hypothetical protein